MGLFAWLRRRFGRPAPAARETPDIDRSLAAAGLQMPQEAIRATELLATIARLRQQSAGWPAILAAVNLQDGMRAWKGGRYGQGQLVLLPDQDVLLVLSDEGELVLVRATPERFKEIARAPGITGKTWNHPVVVGDLLLVRNGEEMAAFRLPELNR